MSELKKGLEPVLSLPISDLSADRVLLADAIELDAALGYEVLIRAGEITVYGIASDGSPPLPAERPGEPIPPEAWPMYAIEWTRSAAVLVEEGPDPPGTLAFPYPDPRSPFPRAWERLMVDRADVPSLSIQHAPEGVDLPLTFADASDMLQRWRERAHDAGSTHSSLSSKALREAKPSLEETREAFETAIKRGELPTWLRSDGSQQPLPAAAWAADSNLARINPGRVNVGEDSPWWEGPDPTLFRHEQWVLAYVMLADVRALSHRTWGTSEKRASVPTMPAQGKPPGKPPGRPRAWDRIKTEADIARYDAETGYQRSRKELTFEITKMIEGQGFKPKSNRQAYDLARKTIIKRKIGSA